MPAQSIRPSQYITTYGPGSILEGRDGPRIVLGLEHSHAFGQQPDVVTYAIQDAGLSSLLPDQAQVVRLPTNAERQVRDSDPIYETDPFPHWSLCVDHGRLYRYQRHSVRTGCPYCSPHATHWDAWRRSRREAVRFVLACPSGHLADVDWRTLMQHHNPGCAPQTLAWQGGGGALRNIHIVCPDCHGSVNLGTAYGRDWHCPGFFPERRATDQGCQANARIMQRGAANLHVAELATAVTIPRLDTALHQALASNQVRPVLIAMEAQGGISQGGQLRTILQTLAHASAIPSAIIAEVGKYDDDALMQAASDALSMTLPTTSEGARLNEFRELQRAATHGHPSQPSQTPGAPPLFEVIPGNVIRALPGPAGHTLRVTPVSRVRVVMAQLGYRRMGGGLVSSVYTDGQNRWLPGVELYGEGVFIDLTPQGDGAEAATQHLPLTDPDSAAWLKQWQSADDPPMHPHPVFVWWHTLAHRLILALSIDSGYSSAAVRERVYVRVDPVTGAATGGVLLYTAQPGGDGTLGGLIALVPRFARVLRGALRSIDCCSNDPLCSEEHYRPDRCNGAICYACGLVSETACEFRNMFLDRNVLRHNQP